jgi:predicted nucleotidyltransferase
MLIEIDKRKLNHMVEKYRLRLLVYYGSYARQTDYDHSRSDIDIAFISDDRLGSRQLFDLTSDLILLHRKSDVHLADLQTASGLVKEAVANDGRVLYEESEGFFTSLCPYLYKSCYETRKFRKVSENYLKRIGEDLRNV